MSQEPGPDGPRQASQDGNREQFEHQNALVASSYSTSNNPPVTPVVTDSSDDSGDSLLPFHVVGIGASAGGIQACIELLQTIPADTGLAFVVVLHLLADQPSHLREILSRHTGMTVETAADGARLEPNCVYVAAENTVVNLEKGVFRLSALNRNRTRRSIDQFFYSLASDQKNRAIGIVLSGMDGDGAMGLRAIKGEGGITMVQLPDSAEYPDMPLHSIGVDHVDVIAEPRLLGVRIGELARRFGASDLSLLQDGVSLPGDNQYFQRVLSLMRNVSGVDFRLYKAATVRRRIARRMLLHRLDNLRDYVSLLQSNSKELRNLQEDTLINVTRFFRDPEVFEALKATVLPSIFEGRDPSQQVRLWVAGCSTGEEVYSLAMCVLEFVSNMPIEPPIQIFGTDASETNIQKARAGLYPDSIVSDVSQERLRRFFVKADKGFQVSKRIRDLCIFARQNLCHDPPFSRMDVISCRNVLIYFGPDLQRQLIPTFHYALRPEGFLLLGTSETIREFTNLFSLSDRIHKIYSRSHGSSARILTDILPRSLAPELLPTAPSPAAEPWADVDLQRASDRLLLARYAPPSVVINDRLEILNSRGRINPFLEIRPGLATFDLMRMTHDTVAPQVRAAIQRAMDLDIAVQVEGLQVTEGEATRQATLEVLPIHTMEQRTRYFLLVFAPAGSSSERNLSQREAITTTSLTPGDRDRQLAQLRHDLSSPRIYLQALLEERDAKNQELVSANEEIQSANEELQSTNEELETTKEELQSSNEELHTVNDELQNRNAVLTQASNDLLNLLNSVNLPVLMLSNDLTIRHFTPPTQRVMNVRSTDIGRPFRELRVNLNVEDLTPLFNEVLDTLGSRELEVQGRNGHWYLLRVRPYRTADNKIEGLVVALVDIDQLRRSQLDLLAARDFARSIIQGVPLPLAVVDSDLRITVVNQAFTNLTGMSSGDLERRYLPALAGQIWGLDHQLREHLEQLPRADSAGQTFAFEHVTLGPQSKVFSIRGSVLKPDQEQYFLVTIEDITAHQEAQRVLKAEKDRLASQVEATSQALGRSKDELRALTMSLFTSQEEERRRIARELHDDVSQRLAALDIEGFQVENSLPKGGEAAREGLQRIRARISHLSDDVRSMSHRLHPSTIEDLGLQTALKALTDDFGQRENMIATFFAQDVPENLSLPVATALYRIAQEALRNVAKHAGKTHVRVSLRGTGSGVQLQITDSGAGFDMADGRSGLGLLSMEERARHIGATFALKSGLGEGTRIILDVPLLPLEINQADHAG